MSEDMITILLVDGVAGKSLYIDDLRVAGPKPWGGGRTLQKWRTPRRNMVEALERPPTEAQIKHMVARFLAWKLPENFRPDAGISFKATFNEHTAHPMRHEPSGTNLFDATQADAMVRYMVEGMPREE